MNVEMCSIGLVISMVRQKFYIVQSSGKTECIVSYRCFVAVLHR